MASSRSPDLEASRPPLNPILRNAIRLSLSPNEYKQLHQYATQRAPASLGTKIKNGTISPSKFDALVKSSRGGDKFNEAALRASLRVFLSTALGMKIFETIKQRFLSSKSATPPATKSAKRITIRSSLTLRLSLSLSLLVLIHRLLHRFFTRLRSTLLTPDARPFRDRNPRISALLTSKYAPAIGASAAGFALNIYPDSGVHASAAIFMGTRAAEFLWNVGEGKGLFEKVPWWVGSWMLMPISCGQLFWAFVFERESVPKWFGSLLFKLTPNYIQQRPESFPADRHWPDRYEIVDSLGSISKMKWPAFTSPILHPNNPSPLPATVQSISPITSPAHAALSSLSCALLHPSTPSCLTAYVHHNLLAIPQLARFLTPAFLALSLLSYKSFLSAPLSSTNALFRKILSMTFILSTSIGSAWGSICLFNTLLSRKTLPTKRFFLSGAAGGLPFAIFARGGGKRSHFLSFFRVALDTAWKVGPKRGLWRRWKGIEVFMFVVAWAIAGCVLEGNAGAVDDKMVRKGLTWLKGDGYVDLVEKRKGKKAVRGGEVGEKKE